METAPAVPVGPPVSCLSSSKCLKKKPSCHASTFRPQQQGKDLAFGGLLPAKDQLAGETVDDTARFASQPSCQAAWVTSWPWQQPMATCTSCLRCKDIELLAGCLTVQAKCMQQAAQAGTVLTQKQPALQNS